MERHLSNFLDITESALGLVVFFSIAAISAYGVVMINPSAQTVTEPSVAGLSTSVSGALDYRLVYSDDIERNSYNGYDKLIISKPNLIEGYSKDEFIEIENKTSNEESFFINLNTKSYVKDDLQILIQNNSGQLYPLDFGEDTQIKIEPYQTNRYSLIYSSKEKINFPIQLEFKLASEKFL
ncbi:hypothetical protein KC678_03355 [Candidatus Dojkabacteria bacterium]|uniref:Uncharacterized protein n=1 Tax=Candidatus Dojkabacteria bacterium TaxID=2099670 RepID=A0A955L1R5_9BACT|nr:hypothetical protein [Candidatus Dojkabacteria bacterium]